MQFVLANIRNGHLGCLGIKGTLSRLRYSLQFCIMRDLDGSERR
jgi:hypothetical protein